MSTQHEVSERIRDRLNEMLAPYMPRPVKYRYFQAGTNGPMFCWTVETIDGKYESMVYRPKGKGSRSDKAEQWELVHKGRWKVVRHATRRAAKARALRLHQKEENNG